MSWRELLQKRDEAAVLPWVGGAILHGRARSWRLAGAQPAEHGWHCFTLQGRKARWREAAAAQEGQLGQLQYGYLVADRLVPDEVALSANMAELARSFERVHLIEPGLDRFVRIAAGRVYGQGPLIFEGQQFPLGPEDDVLQAFLDRADSVDPIRDVAPALAGAFAVESWWRDEAERRRREERQRREAEERRRAIEQRRQQLVHGFGDGVGRRELAGIDFAEAAEAALAVGGAEYLDHRAGQMHDEVVVRFRLGGRRFECTCNRHTLRIIDAGICLVDHDTDERGDSYFTLESLPGVINQAEHEGRLVVFRHI